MTNPVRDLVDEGSWEDGKVQEAVQSASTKHSSPREGLRLRMRSLSLVDKRYRHILLIAFVVTYC